MHIDRYYENILIPNDILNLFKEYEIEVPILLRLDVEDSTLGTYVFENGLELEFGCTWCMKNNHSKFSLLKNNPNYFIEQKQKKEQERQDEEQIRDLLFKSEYINFDFEGEEQKILDRLNKIQNQVSSYPLASAEEVGLSVKLFLCRINKMRANELSE